MPPEFVTKEILQAPRGEIRNLSAELTQCYKYGAHLQVGGSLLSPFHAIFRYVCRMTNFRFLVLVGFAAVGQGAALTIAHAFGDGGTQEQRRAELRIALKARNVLETADSEKEMAPVKQPSKRHLSDLERANLREQLRQQRRDNKSDNQ